MKHNQIGHQISLERWQNTNTAKPQKIVEMFVSWTENDSLKTKTNRCIWTVYIQSLADNDFHLYFKFNFPQILLMYL